MHFLYAQSNNPIKCNGGQQMFELFSIIPNNLPSTLDWKIIYYCSMQVHFDKINSHHLFPVLSIHSKWNSHNRHYILTSNWLSTYLCVCIAHWIIITHEQSPTNNFDIAVTAVWHFCGRPKWFPFEMCHSPIDWLPLDIIRTPNVRCFTVFQEILLR